MNYPKLIVSNQKEESISIQRVLKGNSVYNQYHFDCFQDSFWIQDFIEHVESNKEGKDQESIQSSTPPDPGYQWESDNVTIRNHKREPRGQAFPSRWPQGINKQRIDLHEVTLIVLNEKSQ